MSEDIPGLSTFDFAGLPPAGLALVRFLLRQRSASHSELVAYAASRGTDEASSTAMIAVLLTSGTLVKLSDDPEPRYRVQLKSKGNTGARPLWNRVIDDEQATTPRGRAQALWDTLSQPEPPADDNQSS